MSLRRSNSIAKSALHLSTPSSSSSSSFSFSFFLLPTTPTIPSYTSLRDLIPGAAAAHSPTAASGDNISIRNHLVKQAAYAYLQPMTTSPDSAADHLFRRVSAAVLKSPLFSVLRAITRALAHAFCFCFR